MPYVRINKNSIREDRPQKERTHKEGVFKAPVFKMADGNYRCISNGCEWVGSKNHHWFKTHLKKHINKELAQNVVNLGVSNPSVLTFAIL